MSKFRPLINGKNKKTLKFKRITYGLGFLATAVLLMLLTKTQSWSVEFAPASGSYISSSLGGETNLISNSTLSFETFFESTQTIIFSNDFYTIPTIKRYENRDWLKSSYVTVLRT